MDTILSVGLIGAFLGAATALHLHLTTPPAKTVLDQSTDEIDAEFFRIIDRAIR
jgi:hypothetical protein